MKPRLGSMRRASPDELGLWHRAMRGVIPLRSVPPPRRPVKAETSPVGGEMRTLPPERPTRPLPPPPPARPPLDRFAGIDRASVERLKRGRYPVEARLDLHGLT